MLHSTGRAPADATNEAAGRATRLAYIPAPLLTISEQRVGRRAVLSVVGEVDITTAADLRAAIETAGTGAFEIWVDLGATTFMDSTGLHALSRAHTRLTDAGLRLALICPEGPVRRVLTLTGFDRMIEIHESRSAANDATIA
jgi:anti-sigma B factor antagonist